MKSAGSARRLQVESKLTPSILASLSPMQNACLGEKRTKGNPNGKRANNVELTLATVFQESTLLPNMALSTANGGSVHFYVCFWEGNCPDKATLGVSPRESKQTIILTVIAED